MCYNNLEMKIGIIIDSASGLTKKEADARGWGYLPLFFNIDGKEFKDGIDIEVKSFYDNLSIEMDVHTSATPPGLIMEEYERMSKVFDHVVVYGISTELSSQSSNLAVFAKEFENVHVVSSKGVGEKIVYDIEKTLELAKRETDINKIIEYINNLSKKQFGIALPATLKWLIKGGRINPAIAQLAKLFKIVPMLAYTNGKLEKYGKGKDFLKTVGEGAKIVASECDPASEIYIYHGGNKQINDIAIIVEKIIGKKPVIKYVPPIISIHTGPGLVAIMGSKK